MPDSILDTTKKMLMIAPEDTDFDLDIITHINSVFFILQQLGVGPANGFFVNDRETNWTEFVGDQQINAVKSYVFIKVKLLFDPPATSFAIDSLAKTATELEWRLNVQQEGVRHPWVDPLTNSSLITVSPE